MVALATVAALDIIFWFCRGQRVCSCAALDRSCNGAAACGSREAPQRHLRGVGMNVEASSDSTGRQSNTVSTAASSCTLPVRSRSYKCAADKIESKIVSSLL